MEGLLFGTSVVNLCIKKWQPNRETEGLFFGLPRDRLELRDCKSGVLRKRCGLKICVETCKRVTRITRS